MSAYSVQNYEAFKSAIDNAEHVLQEGLPGETELDHAKRIQTAFMALARFAPDMQEGIAGDTSALINTLQEVATAGQAAQAGGGSFFGRIKAKAEASQKASSNREIIEGMHDNLGETIYVRCEKLRGQPFQPTGVAASLTGGPR